MTGTLASLKASAAFKVAMFIDKVPVGLIIVEPVSPPVPSILLLPDSIDVTTD